MQRFIITVILLLSTAIANFAFSRPEAELPRRPLNEFPKVIGDWKAVNDQIIDVFGPDSDRLNVHDRTSKILVWHIAI